MRPRQWHDRIPAAPGGTGRRQVAVLAPQQEAATVVVGPEEMDCEHSVDCTGVARYLLKPARYSPWSLIVYGPLHANLARERGRDAGGPDAERSPGSRRLTRCDEGWLVPMRSVIVTGPGTTDVVEIPVPAIGPRDLLIRMRACGICGSDALYISYGGIPPRQGATPLGHEPAGEVVEVGAQVDGIAVGDHVVVNPIAAGQTGNGGPFGGLSDFLKIEDAELGRNLAVVPNHVPFDIAAINEPMAVSRHAVNRTRAQAGRLGGHLRGGAHRPRRRHCLQAEGGRERRGGRRDPRAPGDGPGRGRRRRHQLRRGRRRRAPQGAPRHRGQCAGGTQGGHRHLSRRRRGARRDSDGPDRRQAGRHARDRRRAHSSRSASTSAPSSSTELNIVTSMGYPTEIFEVTGDIAANVDRYSSIVSDRFAFDDVQTALLAASTPGTRGKVVVTFD